MTVTTTYRDETALVPRAGTLYDVIDIILDRGMVIDVFLRVSLVGIEILKVDVRVVIASVDTYLRFAEACDRVNLESDSRSRTVPELLGMTAGSVPKKGLKKAAKATGRKAKNALTGSDDDEDEDEAYEYEATAGEEEEEPEREAATRRPSRGGGSRKRSTGSRK